MIHTIELRAFMSQETYAQILQTKEHSFIKDHGYYSSRKYSYMGINKFELKKIKKPTFTCYYANIIINLHLIINYEPGMTQEDETHYRNTPIPTNMINDMTIFSIYQKIFDIFPMLNRCGFDLSYIDGLTGIEKAERLIEWNTANYYAFALAEIDYTYDIPIPFVETYNKLINLGRNPYGNKRIAHTHENGEDNIYVKNYSVKLNFYDKERELNELFNDSDMASRFGVYRIEVGFFKSKLNAIKYNGKAVDINDRVLFDFANIELSHDEVIKYVKKFTFSGNYYDYETACKIIDSTDSYTPLIKAKLKELLRLIKKHNGYESYISYAVSQGKKERTIKDHIKKIEALGINPVTLSQREQNAYPIDGGGYWLPSLLTIIDRIYEIEKDNASNPENVIELMDYENLN